MQKRIENRYFYIGLAVFYILNFIAPSKPFYFSAYFVTAFIFYLGSRNLRRSLVYLFILSFFSEIGLAARFFQLEPVGYSLGAGFVITPMTVILPVLFLLTLKEKITKVKTSDKLILIFFVWNAVFFFFFPTVNIFYGFISLAELVIAYFILRNSLSAKDIPTLIKLLISIMIFQIAVGYFQIIKGGKLGLIAEPGLFDNPYGISTIEDTGLSRISGTFGHPNVYASFLVSFFPFLFLFLKLPIYWSFLKAGIILPIFFTYSRIGWGMFLLSSLFLGFRQHSNKITAKIFGKFNAFILSFLAISAVLFLFPYFAGRIQSLPISFTEDGSVNVRIRLAEEAISLFLKYPVTGVGMNYSLSGATYHQSTDIYTKFKPGSFYKVHNAFLEILTETGLIGLFAWILFMFFTLKYGFKTVKTEKDLRLKSFRKAAIATLLMLIIFSQFNPFYHTYHFRLFFLLSVFILI